MIRFFRASVNVMIMKYTSRPYHLRSFLSILLHNLILFFWKVSRFLDIFIVNWIYVKSHFFNDYLSHMIGESCIVYFFIEDNSCYNAIPDFWRSCSRSSLHQKYRPIVVVCISRGTKLHRGCKKLLTHRSPRADGTSRTAQIVASSEMAAEC